MLFTNGIILIDEKHEGALKSKGFRLDRIKIKCLECKFNNVTDEFNVEVSTNTQVIIFKRESFKYFGSLLIEGNRRLMMLYVTHRIGVRVDEINGAHKQ